MLIGCHSPGPLLLAYKTILAAFHWVYSYWLSVIFLTCSDHVWKLTKMNPADCKTIKTHHFSQTWQDSNWPTWGSGLAFSPSARGPLLLNPTPNTDCHRHLKPLPGIAAATVISPCTALVCRKLSSILIPPCKSLKSCCQAVFSVLDGTLPIILYVWRSVSK